MRRLAWLMLPLLMAGALLLAGCSTVKGYLFPPGEKLDWDSLSLYVDPAANRDFPLAVDLVFVADEALAKRVAAMKAADWFGARDALRNANRDALQVVSLELAPGDSLTLPEKRIPDTRLFAALVFADYFAPGEHSARLEKLAGKVAIEFGATELSVHATEK